jgi:hypothetical protein
MRMDFFCGDAQVGRLYGKIGLFLGGRPGWASVGKDWIIIWGAPRLGVCRERLDYYLGGRRPGWASKGEDWIIVWGADAQVGRL